MNAGILKTLAVTASSLLLFSCTFVTTDYEFFLSPWQPVTIGKATVPDNTDIFVSFNSKSRVRGNGGCNPFYATHWGHQTSLFSTQASLQIKEFRLASALKVCSDEIMALDDTFTTTLQAAAAYKRNAENLVLLDDNDAVIMILRRKAPD